jgi:hypothetical protein
MAFSDLYQELRGQIPALSIFLAQSFVRRAWRDIRRHRAWSFLVEEGVLQCPASLTTGTVSCTQFSDQVTPDAAAIAVLDVLGLNPAVTKRQFSLSAGAPIYNIKAYDGVTLTLDRPYQETTVAGSAYRIFRCYYEPPAADFVRFIDVRDIQNARTIKLGMSKEELDLSDPQRTNTGDPYQLVTYKADSAQGPLYELWPHPTSQKSYVCLYHRRGTDLQDDEDTLPSIIPESLVIDRAMVYAYEWAAANAGREPTLQGVNWLALKADRMASYREELSKLIREDEEVFLQSIVVKGSMSGFPYPLDANFLQSHDFSGY